MHHSVTALARRAILLSSIAAVAVGLGAMPLSAATVSITFDGFNFAYDGTTLTDAGSADPDALTSASFSLDGALIPGGTLTAGQSADMAINVASISAVLDMDSNPTGTFAGTGSGTFSFDFGSGYGLTLDVNDAEVLVGPAGISVVASSSNADVSTQSLPFDLAFVPGTDLVLSFDGLTSAVTYDGDGASQTVATFTASGSGDVAGSGIPEPTTLLPLALGTLALLRRR